MYVPLEPHPPIVFDESGAPVSSLYGDVFRSRSGARAEAREVFIDGCGLPVRWRAAQRPGTAVARPFVILELGFGAGVNFLETLAAWRVTRPAGLRLHYVSIEAHPLARGDLTRLHECLECAGTNATHLQECWPEPLPGLHAIDFAGGEVRLTLAFGQAEHLLPKLSVAADAIFLDGFAPGRNPAMWSPLIARAIARRARPGAPFATWTAAAGVRDAFSQAGFAVQRVSGHGGKRHRLQGSYAPRWRGFPAPPALPSWPSNEVLVIGAGLAGAAVAAGFARDGWQVQVLDASTRPGSAGSGQPLAADHLHLSSDDNVLARLTRAALGPRRQLAMTPAVGKLVLDRDAAQTEARTGMLERLAFPGSYARHLSADEAGTLAGIALPRGALWLPAAHVDDPCHSIAHWLDHPAIRVHCAVRVEQLCRTGDEWSAHAADGTCLARAALVVLANAGDAVRLAMAPSIALRAMSGQSTWLPAAALPGLRRAVSGLAWAAPVNGRILAGATFEAGEDVRLEPCADDSNLRRLARMLAGDENEADAFVRAWAGSLRTASHGVRWTSPDRLPMIGVMPDEAGIRARAHELARNGRLPLPLLPGLYGTFGFGARGTLWAALAGVCLPAMAIGAPPPIEADLLRAIDPVRPLQRLIRKYYQ